MEQIFKEQRDRFRKRVQELEVEKHTLSAKISAYISIKLILFFRRS